MKLLFSLKFSFRFELCDFGILNQPSLVYLKIFQSSHPLIDDLHEVQRLFSMHIPTFCFILVFFVQPAEAEAPRIKVNIYTRNNDY